MLAHPVRGRSRDKILVELSEAEVEIGFGLVDDAKVYRAGRQMELTSRVLLDAVGVLADIEHRLEQLGVSESGPFRPLVAELRTEIAAVDSEKLEI